ncbi:MAG: hypothetical protein JW746_06285 [Candidatus Krumholzibacteriota bacterium]|nr:hypothetical protein [Candidatus Krumholzibacteriota bacterium]
MKYKIDFDSIRWSSPIAGVRHKVFPFQDKKLRLVEYSSDMEPHWCDRGHAGYILEGRFQIEFAEGTEVFGPGDGVVIPDGPDHRHKATVLSEIVMAVFIEGA